MHAELHDEGLDIGRHSTARLMGETLIEERNKLTSALKKSNIALAQELTTDRH